MQALRISAQNFGGVLFGIDTYGNEMDIRFLERLLSSLIRLLIIGHGPGSW